MSDTAQTKNTVQLPKEIVLRVENLRLKMGNVQLRLQAINAEVQNLLRSKTDVQSQMESLRLEVLSNFNVDLATVQLDDNGNCTPSLPASMPGSPLAVPVPGVR